MYLILPKENDIAVAVTGWVELGEQTNKPNHNHTKTRLTVAMIIMNVKYRFNACLVEVGNSRLQTCWSGLDQTSSSSMQNHWV